MYVDVTVGDKSGHIVPGLTQLDFKLEEDGKPQTIDFFTAHTYDMAAAERVQKQRIVANPRSTTAIETPAPVEFRHIVNVSRSHPTPTVSAA